MGLFGVKLFVSGAWRTVIIDDRFPCVPRETEAGPAAAAGEEWRPVWGEYRGERADESCLWAMVATKAWLKLFGGSDVGPLESVTNTLTAGHVSTVDLRAEAGWQALVRLCSTAEDAPEAWAVPQGVMVCCSMLAGSQGARHGSKARLRLDRAQERGLTLGRRYLVLGGCQLPGRHSGATRRLLKLHDPSGVAAGWKGAWRRDDRRWTAELKKLAGFPTACKERGTFFMSCEDFAVSAATVGLGVTVADSDSRSLLRTGVHGTRRAVRGGHGTDALVDRAGSGCGTPQQREDEHRDCVYCQRRGGLAAGGQCLPGSRIKSAAHLGGQERRV